MNGAAAKNEKYPNILLTKIQPAMGSLKFQGIITGNSTLNHLIRSGVWTQELKETGIEKER